MNATTWIPAIALMALFAGINTASAASRTHHTSTMQMSKKDARAIVEGRRTQWNSLYRGEPAPAPPVQRAAPSAEVTEQEPQEHSHHDHNELLDFVAATGEACLMIVAIPVIVVAAVVVFPLHCLALLH